ncbi:hypothetical protein GFS31_24010 [Leptolyngbya sp. BL0902]|nr:hypothetical protein GFS31_24010 [Leptolyngbya sp. BL0902]
MTELYLKKARCVVLNLRKLIQSIRPFCAFLSVHQPCPKGDRLAAPRESVEELGSTHLDE